MLFKFGENLKKLLNKEYIMFSFIVPQSLPLTPQIANNKTFPVREISSSLLERPTLL